MATESKKLKKNKKLATFIIKKWVNEKDISWGRDYKIVYKLLESYPEEDFWEQLPKKYEASSMAVFASDKGKYALKMQHQEWQSKIKLKSNYEAETFEKFELDSSLEAPTLDFRPKNIKDFCK